MNSNLKPGSTQSEADDEGTYGAAEQLLIQLGPSFHWARSFLSAAHAERATRLYGFCRRVDDLVDESTSPVAAHADLATLRLALRTGLSDDPATSDMLQLMSRCGIAPAIPLDLIEGVESDLGCVRIADVPELLRYCYQVAGTVGQMMSAALDVTDLAASPHAIDLGIAMQLTNICRDVREDALLGRRYLPATLTGAVEPAALTDPTSAVRAAAGQAVLTLLDLADRYYASAELGLHFLPQRARGGILVAARLYREIGVVLRERDADCWSSRASVNTVRKAAVTAQAVRDAISLQRPPTDALQRDFLAREFLARDFSLRDFAPHLGTAVSMQASFVS
jgi:15-cis-phytoene synthase